MANDKFLNSRFENNCLSAVFSEVITDKLMKIFEDWP